MGLERQGDEVILAPELTPLEVLSLGDLAVAPVVSEGNAKVDTRGNAKNFDDAYKTGGQGLELTGESV